MYTGDSDSITSKKATEAKIEESNKQDIVTI
jgi:hypothetical protein